jgi:hypothetical protein
VTTPDRRGVVLRLPAGTTELTLRPAARRR